MKVCFTEKEVEQIVLEFVQRTIAPRLNHVHISNYASDYCVVTQREPEETEESES